MKTITQFNPSIAESDSFLTSFEDAPGTLLVHNASNISLRFDFAGGDNCYIPAKVARQVALNKPSPIINWTKLFSLDPDNDSSGLITVAAYEPGEAIPIKWL